MKLHKDKIRNPNNIFFVDIVDYLVPIFNLSSLIRAIYIPILIKEKKLFNFCMIFIGFVLIFQILTAMEGGLSYIFQTLIFFMKILIFLISIILIDFKNENKNLNKAILTVFLLNIGISAIGIGYTQYGYSSLGIPYGVKGVYKGGNEFSILFLIFVILSPVKKLKHSILLALIGCTLATKVALLGSLYVLIKVSVTRVTPKKIIMTTIILLPLILVFFSYYIGFQSERWLEDLKKSASLINLILSGRDEKLAYVLQAHDTTFLTMLIGHGFYTYQFLTPNYKEFFVEIDSVDLFYSGGIILLGLVYVPILFKLYTAIRQTEVNWVIAFFSILVLSSTSGHVVYNSLLPLLLLNYKR